MHDVMSMCFGPTVAYRIYWFSFPIPRVGITGPAVELSFSFDLPSTKPYFIAKPSEPSVRFYYMRPLEDYSSRRLSTIDPG